MATKVHRVAQGHVDKNSPTREQCRAFVHLVRPARLDSLGKVPIRTKGSPFKVDRLLTGEENQLRKSFWESQPDEFEKFEVVAAGVIEQTREMHEAAVNADPVMRWLRKNSPYENVLKTIKASRGKQFPQINEFVRLRRFGAQSKEARQAEKLFDAALCLAAKSPKQTVKSSQAERAAELQWMEEDRRKYLNDLAAVPDWQLADRVAGACAHLWFDCWRDDDLKPIPAPSRDEVWAMPAKLRTLAGQVLILWRDGHLDGLESVPQWVAQAQFMAGQIQAKRAGYRAARADKSQHVRVMAEQCTSVLMQFVACTSKATIQKIIEFRLPGTTLRAGVLHEATSPRPGVRTAINEVAAQGITFDAPIRNAPKKTRATG